MEEIKYGAPETIRTSGLTLRRGSLYPAELRGHARIISIAHVQFMTNRWLVLKNL